MKLRVIYLLSLFLLVAFKIDAQQLSAFASLDTSKIRIGEHVVLQLSVTFEKKDTKLDVNWPFINDTLSKEVEVIYVSEIDTLKPDKSNPNLITQQVKITLTSFDSGYWAIAPFVFTLNDDTAKKFETQPLLLEVQTVQVDTAEASIKDIKAVFDEDTDWREYLPIIYWTVGIIAALLLIYYFAYKLARKKTAKPIIPEGPKEAPHIIALRALENIRSQKLWQEGKTKEYYTAITDALRTYIEGRYHVMAMELTTDEIMKVMRSQVIDGLSKEKLQQILFLADYVKFAKAQPIDTEHDITLNNAFDFVKGTMREEVNEQNSAFNINTTKN